MKRNRKIWILAMAILIISFIACVKKYDPPAIKASNRYLVVDGVINTGANGITTFNLSRSRNLSDTVSFIPELGAHLSIISAAGNTYPMLDTNNTGKYTSAILNLTMNDQYALAITTSDGHLYQSAFVSPKATAPIDSVTWKQSVVNNGVTINVSTHDPSNSTHYYRWDYSETWQHNAPEQAYWVLINGMVTPLGADFTNDPNQTHQCYTTAPASNITVANSLGLSQDVISFQPITFIPFNNERITIRYSILVNQYAITEDAYQYWLLVQNNSQTLGSLFDLLPSQLNSNIHSLNYPSEPVIGFISACSVQQKRLFITNDQVAGNWVKIEPHNECTTITIPTDPNNFEIYNYEDTSYTPWYFTGNNIPFLIIVKKECVDCRTQGGTNAKPSFW